MIQFSFNGDLSKKILNIIRNPSTDYLRFLINWYSNNLKYKKICQSYMSLVYKTKIGEYVKFYPYAYVSDSVVGDFSYIGVNSIVINTKVGKFCSIGRDCKMGLGTHPASLLVSTSPIFYSTIKQLELTFADKDYFEEFQRITIGNDVWIGSNVNIMDGVSIGDGAIIGANSLVNKDVPSYSIYGGIPAKPIGKRFDEETIQKLLLFQWWDKDLLWLRDNFKKFHNITEFIQEFVN